MKKRALVGIGVAFVLLLAGFLWWVNHNRQPLALGALRQRSSSLAIHSTSSQPPPTNKWFSSLAFKSPSDPVFAYPLAFKTTQQGLAVSYPDITATADTVAAPFVQDVSLQFGQTVETSISHYDDLSVELEIKADNRKVASARLTQGSPYLFLTLEPHAQLTLDTPLAQQGAQDYTLTVHNHNYGIFADPNVNLTDRRFSTQDKPAEFALYIMPDQDHKALFEEGARNPLTKTEVRYAVANGKAETTFVLETKNHKPTPFALLPLQQPKAPQGKYRTLLGEQSVNFIDKHTFTTPLPDMPGELPLEKATDVQRQTLQKTLQSELKTVEFTKNDSYFSGKELYKVANMVQLARQLNMQAEASALQAGLRQGLQKWLATGDTTDQDGSYFYYDTTLKSVVGVPSAFGSEEDNDHHFHYGYFIYSAAILAKYDTQFLADNKAMVNTLIADIANRQRDDQQLPYLRVFDQYAGHSWASGLAPFADGNNQESSSEAANAWYATALWAKVTANTDLASTAQWLYAREVQSAQNYYLDFDKNRPELAGYNHSIMSLLWGGKFDYATFFNAAPEAKLAIQLLPLNPGAQYVSTDKQRARQNYQTMLAEKGGAATIFQDFLVMYLATFDKSAALGQVDRIDSASLDGVLSRSYMLAWLYTR